MNSFTFNGHSTNEFGLLVTGLSTFGSPARRVEKIQVPGRNGDILLDEGTYDNYIARYEICIVDGFKANARSIANWLLSSSGYSNLTDTYNPETFRKASFYSNIDYVVTALARAGQASIEFDCKPQRYFVSNSNINVSASGSAQTISMAHNVEPIITMAQAGTVTVNGKTFTTTQAPITINCQTMQAYNGTTLMNDKMTGDFPVFVKGNNSVTTNKALTITPNYWEL